MVPTPCVENPEKPVLPLPGGRAIFRQTIRGGLRFGVGRRQGVTPPRHPGKTVINLNLAHRTDAISRTITEGMMPYAAGRPLCMSHTVRRPGGRWFSAHAGR